MNLEAGKITMVFVKEFDGRKKYSIGLSKKNKNGSYENGFMNARFKQDVEIANKTRIKIKEAFLSFNVKDNKTFPYIFINDYEIISETNPEHKEIQEMTNDEHYKTKSDTFEQVEINPEDLPF